MRRGCFAKDGAPGIGSSAGVGCDSRGRRTGGIGAGGPSVAGLLVETVDCCCSYAGALAIVAENGDAFAAEASDVAAVVLAGRLAASVPPVA